MGFFQRVAGVAAVACVLAPAGPALGQQGLTDVERFQALQQIIRTQGHRIDGTAADYRCSGRRGTAVITVISDQTGGVVEKKILTLWQGPSTVGPVLQVYHLYLQTEATSQEGGGVSIKSTYDVIPEGQETPLSQSATLPTVVSPYILQFKLMTPEELLESIEATVRVACKPPQSEEPSYPVLEKFSGQSTFSM